jgi:oxygen-independent coproporphyrinogen-3 oxidase
MIGLYIHVPYCTVRCSYCDFYLVPARGGSLAGYVEALCDEIRGVDSRFRGLPADTVYFGGGTPSLLPPALLADVLASIRETFALVADAEVSLEANPEDLQARRIEELAALGFNRVTIGVQALDDRILGVLRRPHTSRQALEAVARARASAVRSVGADLILGLPGQDRTEALAGIDRLAGSGIDHLSVYLLEIHPTTRLGRAIALGRLEPVPDEALAGLYEEAADALVARGFEHYEISNFALPGHRSRHNLKYWTDQEYLGFGPSAHSYAGGERWSNAPRLRAYLAGPAGGIERLDDPQPPAVRGAEALFMGLRLSEGVDLESVRRRYGPGLPSAGDPRIAELESAGLVEVAGDRLRLTRRGRLVSNEVFGQLLGTDQLM